jgi:hypothetical protein
VSVHHFDNPFVDLSQAHMQANGEGKRGRIATQRCSESTESTVRFKRAEVHVIKIKKIIFIHIIKSQLSSGAAKCK